MTFCNIHAKG